MGSILLGLSLVLWPALSKAELVAVGERNSESYRIGVALSALVTLDVQSDRTSLNILPANQGPGVQLQPLLNRVASFALIDPAAVVDQRAAGADLAQIRGVAVLHSADGEPTLLISHERVKADNVSNLTKTMFRNLNKLETLEMATVALDPSPALDAAGLDLHNGVVDLYEDEIKQIVAEKEASAKKEASAEQETAETEPSGDNEVVTEESDVLDAAVDPSAPPVAELEMTIELVSRERDRLAAELEESQARRQSLIREFNDLELSQQVAEAELERLQESAAEHETAANRLRNDLAVVVQERDQAIGDLGQMQQRVNSVAFTSLEDASKAAEAMQQRAEDVEARYREAYEIGQVCLQQQSGEGDQARAALLRIERMEARLEEVAGEYRQCIAERDALAAQ